MFLECPTKSFFRNFPIVQYSLNFVEGYSIQAKMCSNVSAFYSYKKKKLVIRQEDEGYRLRKQKSRNQKWDVRWLQYWNQMSYETQKIFEVNMYFPKEIVKNWDTGKTT